jgi:hypothetical protein
VDEPKPASNNPVPRESCRITRQGLAGFHTEPSEQLEQLEQLEQITQMVRAGRADRIDWRHTED